MAIWKYDQGIVATKSQPYTNFKQRFYHVRYRNQDNDLCRLISASFVYGQSKDETSNPEDDQAKETETQEKFMLWLKEQKEREGNEDSDSDSDDETNQRISSVFSKAILTMSKVITIMDFRLSEKNDIPTNVIAKETEYDILDENGTDKENFLHLAHFEYYLPKCGIESCICTLTNDEEATRRIKDITSSRNIPS